MRFNNLASAFILLAVQCVAVPHDKRDTTTPLYAYGKDIPGLPVYYGDKDGLAYIVKDPPSNFSSLSFTPNNASNPMPGMLGNGTAAGNFYIIPGDNSYEAAGFASSPPSNASTTGFRIIGKQLVYLEGNEFLSQFWAQCTGIEDTWLLKWNGNGSSKDDSVPVTLKTTSPTTLV